MGASLGDADFDGADFHEANLHDAFIMGADLSHAKGLTQDQLDEACADGRTRAPPGLVAKSCHGRIIAPHVVVSIPTPPPPPKPPRYLVEADPDGR
jgi:hypothetical protein